MTPIDAIKIEACNVAWGAAHDHGLGAMVGVLHALRHRAEVSGSWSPVLKDEGLEPYKLVRPCPDVGDKTYKDLLLIVDQIVTEDLILYGEEGRDIRPSNVKHSFNFGYSPPGFPDSVNQGGMWFW
jgi:hypothetical protein